MTRAMRDIFGKLVIYSGQAIAFAVLSYGLVLLIYGRVGISFIVWVGITFVAFSVSYLPALYHAFRSRRGGD